MAESENWRGHLFLSSLRISPGCSESRQHRTTPRGDQGHSKKPRLTVLISPDAFSKLSSVNVVNRNTICALTIVAVPPWPSCPPLPVAVGAGDPKPGGGPRSPPPPPSPGGGLDICYACSCRYVSLRPGGGREIDVMIGREQEGEGEESWVHPRGERG